MNAHLVRYSKFISLVLRHRPQAYGVTLDEHGWAAVDQLIAAANQAGVALTPDILAEVVATNDKQRFALSPDGLCIRARQGHSISVNLDLTPLEPPERLYHGTGEKYLASIRTQGLLRRSRQHVHLSADAETAARVGQRHGKAVVLTVLSRAMSCDGIPFYRSENGVWLVDAVPVAYLRFPVEA
ncbi:MAG: RNA 2'-phosphotransferase [Chloroflexota bacterium]